MSIINSVLNLKNAVQKNWEKSFLITGFAVLGGLAINQSYDIYKVYKTSTMTDQVANNQKIIELAQHTDWSLSSNTFAQLMQLKDQVNVLTEAVKQANRPTLIMQTNQADGALEKISISSQESFVKSIKQLDQQLTQIETTIKNSTLPISEVNQYAANTANMKKIVGQIISETSAKTSTVTTSQIANLAKWNIDTAKASSAPLKSAINVFIKKSSIFAIACIAFITGFYFTSRRRKAQFDELRSFAHAVAARGIRTRTINEESDTSISGLKRALNSLITTVDFIEYGPFPMAILSGRTIAKVNGTMKSELGMNSLDDSWTSFDWELLCKVFNMELSKDLLEHERTVVTRGKAKNADGKMVDYCIIVHPQKSQNLTLISFVPLEYYEALNEIAPTAIDLPLIPDKDSTIVNITEITDQALESIRNIIQVKGLKVAINSEDDCAVFGNKEKLLAALKNLMFNFAIAVAKRSDTKHMIVDIKKEKDGVYYRLKIPDMKLSQALLFENIDQDSGHLRCLEDVLASFEKTIKGHDFSMNLKNNFDQEEKFMYSSVDLRFGI